MNTCKTCKCLAVSEGRYECHRFAPHPIVTSHKPNAGLMYINNFPIIRDIEVVTCGEYQKADETETEKEA